MAHTNKSKYTVHDALIAARTYFSDYHSTIGQGSNYNSIDHAKDYIADAKIKKSKKNQMEDMGMEAKIKPGFSSTVNSSDSFHTEAFSRVKQLGNTTHMRRAYKKLEEQSDKDLILLSFHEDSLSKIPKEYYDQSWIKLNGVPINMCLPTMYIYHLTPKDLQDEFVSSFLIQSGKNKPKKNKIRKQQWNQMVATTVNYYNKAVINLRDEMNKILEGNN